MQVNAGVGRMCEHDPWSTGCSPRPRCRVACRMRPRQSPGGIYPICLQEPVWRPVICPPTGPRGSSSRDLPIWLRVARPLLRGMLGQGASLGGVRRPFPCHRRSAEGRGDRERYAQGSATRRRQVWPPQWIRLRTECHGGSGGSCGKQVRQRLPAPTSGCAEQSVPAVRGAPSNKGLERTRRGGVPAARAVIRVSPCRSTQC